MSKVIFISGTPTVGKTTIASKLASELGAKLIKINDFAFEHNLVLGTDSEKGYKIIDIDKLDLEIQKEFNEEIVIVEGHLAHLCSNPDRVIILRAHPSVLKERLASRNYSDAKIAENLEAEAMGVCSIEAFELHGEKVNEIDCTDLEVNEIIQIAKEIIAGDNSYPIGEIDFMEWLITQ